MTRRLLALLGGPAIFLLIALSPAPAALPPSAQWTAAITAWIALWWITEPVHTSVTALLPLVLLPLCHVMPLKAVSAEYGNDIIFLFLGGFMLGKAVEHWQLHRRIALRLVLWLGSDPSHTVLGFMVATAFISMWISNTATAVMMTPVALAVAARQSVEGGGLRVEGNNPSTLNPPPSTFNFQKALMLGVGYACSIGGLATIVGTPTNAIFIGYAQQKMGTTVSFWQWLLFGFPFATALLLLCWRLLLWLFPMKKGKSEDSANTAVIQEELAALGPISTPEKRLLAVFGLVIAAWITGSLIWYPWVLYPNDSKDSFVAIAGAILLFLIPSGKILSESTETTTKSPMLLDWETAVRIPWGVLLLFGGGLALGRGFDQSGLAGWMGEQLKGLSAMPHVLIVLTVLAVVVLLSELASNIATITMMMPVLAVLASAIGSNPFGLLICATFAASFGFGLPIATAPNTIVFGTGYLKSRDMARAGFLLDGIAVLLLLAFAYLLLPLIWGLNV